MQGSNPNLPSLYTCIYKFYKFGHRMPVPGRFAGCHRTSNAGSGPVCQMPSDVGCRFWAGSSDTRPPVAAGTDHRRMPDRRLPPIPITVGCRAAGCRRYRSPSDAEPPVATGPVLVCQNLYMWLGKPPLFVQVTLNSLCSTHRHKDNNFCSTLYIVGALFDLSMWDTS